MRNPIFEQITAKMNAIHDKKNHDYADDDNPYSNFEFAAYIANQFNHPTDKVYATLLGIKLARLAQLKNGKAPNNESVEDTHLDLSTYSVIWFAHFLSIQEIKSYRGKAVEEGEMIPPNPHPRHKHKLGQCVLCDEEAAREMIPGSLIPCDERGEMIAGVGEVSYHKGGINPKDDTRCMNCGWPKGSHSSDTEDPMRCLGGQHTKFMSRDERIRMEKKLSNYPDRELK